ncbi:MAG: hypothetical protein Fur009_2100 [Candidatus Microgenomates bacterium]
MKMKKNFFWPPKSQEVIKNFANTGVNLFKEMYGSLDDDKQNPYSRISVANVGYSLDAVRGCPLRCSYCVRLSNLRDGFFDKNENLNNKRVFNIIPEKLFDGDVLIKHLIKHPSFIKNYSVIAIGTGSTEAFSPVADVETYKIIKELRLVQKLKNPIWIVTKLGIPTNKISFWRSFFKEFSPMGKIIISITSNGLPSYIESHQADRFLFVEKILDTGVYFTHHLRPIIRNINDDYDNLYKQLKRSLPLVKAVVVGGLRVDPGIIIAWKHINKLDLNILPNKPNEKDLPEEVLPNVKKIIAELNYKNIPVFLHSSQMISYIMNWIDYSLKKSVAIYNNKLVLKVLKNKLIKNEEFLENKINVLLKKMKLFKYIKVIKKATENFIIFEFVSNLLKDYRINRTLLNNLGHYNNKFKLFQE